MTPRSFSAGALIATVTALLMSVLSIAPASAERWTHKDPSGDAESGAYGDIVRARVVFHRHNVKIKIRVRRHQGYYTNVRVDTHKANRGPEFIMIRNSDTWRGRAIVYRVSGWRDFPFGERERCRVRVRTKDSGKVLAWRVPRTCLRMHGELPRRIRVNVQTEEDGWYGDDAPGRRQWSRTIRMG